MADRIAHQPIDDAIRSRLDPEYVAFHDQYIQYMAPDDAKPWDGSVRKNPVPWPNTASAAIPVGSVDDVDLAKCKLRIFTPAATPPSNGWPVLLWFRGGGWVLGDINNLNNLLTRLCAG